MKKCLHCKKTKPLNDFYRDKQKKDGRRPKCKTCENEIWIPKYRANIPEERLKKQRKRAIVKYKYGISMEEYDAMLSAQESKCAICLSEVTKEDQFLSIDHCHSSGEIRGLLCRNCNTAIGMFKERIDSLRRAIEYLEKSPCVLV